MCFEHIHIQKESSLFVVFVLESAAESLIRHLVEMQHKKACEQEGFSFTRASSQIWSVQYSEMWTMGHGGLK